MNDKEIKKALNGVPYQGNKRKIVKDIIGFLPSSENFFDLFGGGGCVSLHAIASGKFTNVYYNDIDWRIYSLLYNCLYQKNDFLQYVKLDKNRFKETIGNELTFADLCINLTQSFGTDFRTYGFSDKQVECINKIIDKLDLSKYKSISDLRCDMKRSFECLPRLQQLEGLQQLERLQQLDFVKGFNMSNKDYQSFTWIGKDDVVYLDPPYFATRGYLNTINEKDFLEFCTHCLSENIFISGYDLLPNCEIIHQFPSKTVFGRSKVKKAEILMKYKN